VRAFDLHPELVGEDLGRAAMIDMAVGEQDLLDLDVVLLRRRLQPVEVAAGIGEGAEHRLRAPQEAAILLQRGHRDDGGFQRGFGHGGGDGAACPQLQPHRRSP
jgi:hypothetical protein